MTPAQLTSILAAINAGISQMQIGNAVVGGTATRVLFVGAGPVLANSADLTYNDATITLAIGAGTGTTDAVIQGPSSTGKLIISNGGGGQLQIKNTGAEILIAAAATDKLGFYGAAPVVRGSPLGTVNGFTAGVGAAVLVDSTFTGDTGASAFTLGDVIRILKAYGLLPA